MTTTYLGLPIRTAVAVGLAAATVGVTIGLALPTPLDRAAPCGVTVEGGEVIPAACSTVDELADRLDTIRTTRSGGRFAATNGAELDADGRAAYLAEIDAVAAACGHLAEQLAYERCEDDVLADHRAEVSR
jgi:hypothetical protein